jgi:Zn-dependent protease with chaperone function
MFFCKIIIDLFFCGKYVILYNITSIFNVLLYLSNFILKGGEGYMSAHNGFSGSKRKIFPDIDPSALQHPLDRMATDQLKKLRGFDILMAKYIELGFERVNRILNNASNVKVGPKQIPILYDMLHEGCQILDMPEPDLYLSQQPEVNAFTSGHTRPYIVLLAGLLEMMDEEEVMAVIAHELGHIKCGHVLYTMMVTNIDMLIENTKQYFPLIGQYIGLGMQLAIESAFITWQRRAELTGDRAALLVMQDPRPCISMLAKLAGGTAKAIYALDPEEFINQARLYKEEGSKGNVNRAYQFLANASKGSHPFAVERVHYLNEWIDSPEYDQILCGNYPRIPRKILEGSVSVIQIEQEEKKYCQNCGQALNTTSKFCSGCGIPA